MADGLPLVPWDVVVIDEAHDVCGDSDRHAASHEMAARARHVVLLTATPHSGDHVRFARLQRLGALDAAGMDDRLCVFRRTRAGLSMMTRRRVRWHRVGLRAPHAELINGLRAFERAVLLSAGQARREAALLLLAVFRKRALSTVRALHISIERRLAWLDGFDRADAPEWVQPRLDFAEDADDLDDRERTALIADVGLDARKERIWLRRLQTLARTAAPFDSKLAALDRLMRRASDPVVIFTEFRHSLQAIEERLAPIRPVAALHGGQSTSERQRALARFLRGDASVLVATDVASQGLNLQTRARWVINLDVPWNPARLEQRIGRVDRLGQTRATHATVFLADHEMEARLVQRLAQRVAAARRAIGGDVLPDLPIPSDAAIRAAVLAGGRLDAPAVADPAPLCTDYQRRARALARCLGHRRNLSARWKTARDPATGARWTAGRRNRRSPGPASIFVFSIPMMDGSGAILERRVVAIRIDLEREPARAGQAAVLVRATQLAIAALGARRRRAARLAADAVRRRLGTERAIGDHLRLIGYPDEMQAGLFDHAASRAFAAGRRQMDDLDRAVRAATDRRQRQSEIQIGRPELFLILRGAE